MAYPYIAKHVFDKKSLEFEILSDADSSVFHEIFTEREYGVLDELIRKASDSIIDIGAHKGFFSVYSANLNSDVPIFAYEPEPENYSELKKNLRTNKILNVFPKNLAVAGKAGKRVLYLSFDSHTHSILGSETATQPLTTQEIDTAPLSSAPFSSATAPAGQPASAEPAPLSPAPASGQPAPAGQSASAQPAQPYFATPSADQAPAPHSSATAPHSSAKTEQIIYTTTLEQIKKKVEFITKSKTCDLLKLDCEGAEFEILRFAPKDILKNFKNIYLEYHEIYEGLDKREIVAILEKAGFKVRVTESRYDRRLGFIFAKQ